MVLIGGHKDRFHCMSKDPIISSMSDNSVIIEHSIDTVNFIVFVDTRNSEQS